MSIVEAFRGVVQIFTKAGKNGPAEDGKLTRVVNGHASPINETKTHYTGYDIENPLAQRVNEISSKAQKSQKILDGAYTAYDLNNVVSKITPFVSSHHLGRVANTAGGFLNLLVSIYGFAASFFSQKMAKKLTFGDLKGDPSSEKLAVYGKGRFGARFIDSTMGMTRVIGAYTGLSQISGRAIHLAGSFSMSLSMAFFFLIARERTKWVEEVRKEVDEKGIKGIRDKLTTLTQDDIHHLKNLTFVEIEPLLEEDKGKRLQEIKERKIVPDALITEHEENIPLLYSIETFMLARRDHYGRFIGPKNVRRILGDSAVENNSKGLSYYKQDGLLLEKINKTTQVYSTLWKVIQVFSLLTIAVSTTANFVTMGIADVVFGIINLAIAVGWSVVDTYFFISDMLEGQYTKDQFIAHLITQASMILLTAGALFIRPFMELWIQVSLVCIASGGIIYNIITDLKRKVHKEEDQSKEIEMQVLSSDC
ncbi:MAG: hypothetical protein FJZ61_05975 [Chlamydiae bacterium]|nr:hypothetical protein [Chlamydiota bacterium]